MDFVEAKNELRKMHRENLFRMVMDQKLSRCLVGGMACGYSFLYKGFRFCVSEVLGKGCLVERLEQWETFYPEKGISKDSLYLLSPLEGEYPSPRKKFEEYKVYYRDLPTRSMVYLGNVIERRKKERGNNLGDLLKKAAVEYANRVPDSSSLFLLG